MTRLYASLTTVVALAVGLQLVAIYFGPLAEVLRVVCLEVADWLIVALLGVVPAGVGQALRAVRAGARDR